MGPTRTVLEAVLMPGVELLGILGEAASRWLQPNLTIFMTGYMSTIVILVDMLVNDGLFLVSFSQI